MFNVQLIILNALRCVATFFFFTVRVSSVFVSPQKVKRKMKTDTVSRKFLVFCFPKIVPDFCFCLRFNNTVYVYRHSIHMNFIIFPIIWITNVGSMSFKWHTIWPGIIYSIFLFVYVRGKCFDYSFRFSSL